VGNGEVDAHRQRRALVDRIAAGEPIRERFWIVRHGIKMTGMPAWRITTLRSWATATFLKKLPGMSE